MNKFNKEDFELLYNRLKDGYTKIIIKECSYSPAEIEEAMRQESKEVFHTNDTRIAYGIIFKCPLDKTPLLIDQNLSKTFANWRLEIGK